MDENVFAWTNAEDEDMLYLGVKTVARKLQIPWNEYPTPAGFSRLANVP